VNGEDGRIMLKNSGGLPLGAAEYTCGKGAAHANLRLCTSID
jgi:hypothetical protein